MFYEWFPGSKRTALLSQAILKHKAGGGQNFVVCSLILGRGRSTKQG
jgi:hypothetical protein